MREKDEDDEIEEEIQNIKVNNNFNISQNLNSNSIINKSNDKYNLLNPNIEFDEIIYFSNYCSVFRKIEYKNPISQDCHPYLPNREFVYSYFEDKRIIKTASQETKNQILGRIKQYSNTHDDKFTKFFLDNMNTYAEILGLESTSNLILPALAKIVDETVAVKIYFLKKLSPLIDFFFC